VLGGISGSNCSGVERCCRKSGLMMKHGSMTGVEVKVARQESEGGNRRWRKKKGKKQQTRRMNQTAHNHPHSRNVRTPAVHKLLPGCLHTTRQYEK